LDRLIVWPLIVAALRVELADGTTDPFAHA